MRLDHTSDFDFLVIKGDFRQEVILGLVTKAPQKSGQSTFDLARRGGPGGQNQAIPGGIKPAAADRVGRPI